MTDTYKYLLYNVSKSIASITLNRPPVNAIHEAMTDEYYETQETADNAQDEKDNILTEKS